MEALIERITKLRFFAFETTTAPRLGAVLMTNLTLDQIRNGDRFIGHGDDPDARVCNRQMLSGSTRFTVEPEGGDWYVVIVRPGDIAPDGTVPGFYRPETTR